MLSDTPTDEQVATYVRALEEEKAGYRARVNALKHGRRDTLDEAELADRVKQVDAEIARVRKLGGKGKADGDAAAAA